MTPIQFGFCMPAENRHPHRRATWVADLSRALTLIQGHFDSAWMVDHLMFDDADVLEGFTALTYLAALHPQLRFGHAVLCQSFRNPALVAKMAATLQFMSGGRYILGIGAGWHREEYQAYGYDFPPGDLWQDVRSKLHDYFSIGVDQVWIVEQERQTVVLYHSTTASEEFTVGDVLQGQGVLQGLELPVASLFAEL